MSKNPVTPLTAQQTSVAEAKASGEKYPHREAVALDIFVDETLDGPMDETISARASRAALRGKWWGIALSRFLNFFQSNHGPQAQAGDLERAKEVEKTELSSGGVKE